VTTELCGHWEHEGPCRWPHDNSIAQDGSVAKFRTVFVAAPADFEEVDARIKRALSSAKDGTFVSRNPRPLSRDEERLAARLAQTS
jgi:hypothetical protein